MAFKGRDFLKGVISEESLAFLNDDPSESGEDETGISSDYTPLSVGTSVLRPSDTTPIFQNSVTQRDMNAELEEERRRGEEEVRQAKMEGLMIKNQMEQLMKANAELQRQLSQAKKELADADCRVAEVQSERRLDRERHNEVVQDLKRDLSLLRAQVSSARQEDSASQVRSLEQKVLKLSSKLEGETQRRTEAESLAAERSAELKSLYRDRQNATAQNRDQERLLWQEQMQAMLSSVPQPQDMSVIVESLEKRNDSLLAQIADVRAELEEQKSRAMDSHSRLAEVNAELRFKAMECERLNATMLDLDQERTALKEQLQAVMSTIPLQFQPQKQIEFPDQEQRKGDETNARIEQLQAQLEQERQLRLEAESGGADLSAKLKFQLLVSEKQEATLLELQKDRSSLTEKLEEMRNATPTQPLPFMHEAPVRNQIEAPFPVAFEKDDLKREFQQQIADLKGQFQAEVERRVEAENELKQKVKRAKRAEELPPPPPQHPVVEVDTSPFKRMIEGLQAQLEEERQRRLEAENTGAALKAKLQFKSKEVDHQIALVQEKEQEKLALQEQLQAYPDKILLRKRDIAQREAARLQEISEAELGCRKLESRLRQALAGVRERERTIASAELTSRQNEERRQKELQILHRRLKEEATHQLELEKKTSSSLRRRLNDVETQMQVEQEKCRRTVDETREIARKELSLERHTAEGLRKRMLVLAKTLKVDDRKEKEQQILQLQVENKTFQKDIVKLRHALQSARTELVQLKREQRASWNRELHTLRLDYLTREHQVVLDGDRGELAEIKRQLDSIKPT